MSDYKSTILAQFGLGVVKEEIDGAEIYVRKMSAKQYEDYMFKRMDPKTRELDFSKYPGMRADLVTASLCTPDGDQLFASAEECNSTLTNEFVKKCFDLIQKINGATTDAQVEAEKN